MAHKVALDECRQLRITVGVEVDRLSEDRQGYINDLGVRGALKRNELNQVKSQDAYLQAFCDLSSQWALTAGARSSQVAFESQDRFIVPGNTDDSGSRTYSATNPVVGLAWRATPRLNLYANMGRGFETPTFKATFCKRILRGFVARGLLEKADAKDMLAYQHSGFSVDAGVHPGARPR